MSDLMVLCFKSVQSTATRTGPRHQHPPLRTILRTYLTRQALLDLSARQRDDIGISASAAVSETARLPWDVNPGRRLHGFGIMSAIWRAMERVRTRQLTARLEAQAETARFF